MREEGEYIRPTVDGGGFLFASFHTTWSDGQSTDVRRRFAFLLISPAAVGRTASQFAVILSTPADLACLVAGDEVCIKLLRALATVPDAKLHEGVCDYLKSQLRQTCQ
ncbi:MAG: hypothetical protein LAP87_11660 [Acidobacteriia bacterium]|nr:hypothetical protein [Terriglobia bacterium]